MSLKNAPKRPSPQSGLAMTEYAIVFFAVSLVFVLILNNMFIETANGYVIRQTIPGLNITNPLYGYKAYFERISNFLALPIP